ncbi:MAG: hypothetical protein ACE5EY_08755, partial [Anaerolineae bacterium]
MMKNRLFFLLMLFIALITACAPAKTTPTPTAISPPAQPAGQGTSPTAVSPNACGDGVCGRFENAQNCPLDCTAGAAPPETAVAPAPTAPAASPLTGDNFTPAPVPELASGSGGQQPLY